MLSEMIVPDSVTHIGESAFEDCSKMKRAVLGQGLVSIGKKSVEFNIFKGCISLEDLSMPSLVSGPDTNDEKGGQVLKLFNSDSVCMIDQYSYSGASYRLRKITITSGTEIYPFEFCHMPVREIILPDTITKISEHSFKYCTYLKEIRIPASVIEIGEKAFDNCDILKTIYFDKNIEAIDENAFSWSHRLSFIYYNGSKDQWDKLLKSNNNTDLSKATVYFVETDNYIQKVGNDLSAPETLEQKLGCGDIDGNGTAELTDLTYLSMYLLSDYDFTISAKVYSDITRDGKIDIADLAALKMIVMKAI